MLAIYILVRRRYAAFFGMIAGGAVMLLLAGIELPLRLSIQYFTEILPRLGGTALAPENVSLLAALGRDFLALFDGPTQSSRCIAATFRTVHPPAES